MTFSGVGMVFFFLELCNSLPSLHFFMYGLLLIIQIYSENDLLVVSSVGGAHGFQCYSSLKALFYLSVFSG